MLVGLHFCLSPQKQEDEEHAWEWERLRLEAEEKKKKKQQNRDKRLEQAREKGMMILDPPDNIPLKEIQLQLLLHKEVNSGVKLGGGLQGREKNVVNLRLYLREVIVDYNLRNK
mmetsp:Transcript_36451/g.57168  ORF Transcript_36451/g.57168 Transcript_36451/m.57168 type:complete len:114 (+) Transcript_36451:1005-1346(+)